MPVDPSPAVADAGEPTPGPVSSPDPELAPEPAPEPEPEPAPATVQAPVPSFMHEIEGLDREARWAWALERMPALADEEALDREKRNAAFAAWLREGRVWVRIDDDPCFPVTGRRDGASFIGRARETEKIEGGTKTRSWMTVEISATGIVESGPGGETLEKNAKGRWEVTGGFGTGCMDVLVDGSVSEVTRDAVYFGAYDYTVTIECAGTRTETQVCDGGGTRVCESCSSLWARPHASGRGFGRASTRINGRRDAPTDCTAPCPADEVTALIEPLNAITRGRTFTETEAPRGAVYKSRKRCERDPRWKRTSDDHLSKSTTGSHVPFTRRSTVDEIG